MKLVENSILSTHLTCFNLFKSLCEIGWLKISLKGVMALCATVVSSFFSKVLTLSL